MHAKEILPIACGLIAVIAVGLAWREARRAADSNSARRVLAGQRSQTEAAAVRAAARLTAAQQRATELREALDALAKAKTPKVETMAAPEHARAVTQSEVMAIDPRVQALALVEQRASAADRYAMFFRTAGLSPAQIDRFLDAVARRDAQFMDLRHTAQSLGLADNDPAMVKLNAQIGDEYRNAQRELLGATSFKQLNDFERGSPVRQMVSELAGSATVAGVPFTTAQLDQLTQIFAASAGAQPGHAIDPRKIDWAHVDAAAQMLLSPEQMEFFRSADSGNGTGRYSAQFRRTTDAAKKADAQRPPPKSPSSEQ